MASLLFLTSEDFAISQGPKGPVLSCGIRGYTLILFYSDSCAICREKSIPMFRRLPGTINGVQFGMTKVDSKLVELSRQTIKPFTYVPCMILFIDGKPFMEYKDNSQYNPDNLRKFILDVYTNLQSRQQFSSQQQAQQGQPAGQGQQQVQNAGPERKEYSLGIPIWGDSKSTVCYLDFTKAYDPKNGAAQPRGATENMNMR